MAYGKVTVPDFAPASRSHSASKDNRRISKRIVSVAVALIFSLSACSMMSPIKHLFNRDATSKGSIVAVRISPQLSDIAWGAKEGYVLLSRDDGSSVVIDAGSMDVGQLFWGEDGLFFGGPDEEYQLTDAGLTSLKRGSNQVYETTRFSNPERKEYISIYNAGFAEDGYRNQVVVNLGGKLQTWESSGRFASIAQCGEKIVGITDSEDLFPSVRLTLDSPNESDVLLQLYPKPKDPAASVLAEYHRDGGSPIEHAMRYMPCVKDTVYVLGIQDSISHADSEVEIPVLLTWNINSGDRKVLPLVSPNGKRIELNLDDISGVEGHLSSDRSQYRWVSSIDGKVRSVDLSAGVTSELFRVALSYPARGDSQFIFTEHSIFVLDVNKERDPMIFSRYDLETGEHQKFFEIKGVPSINRFLMGRNEIRDMAINPAWLAAHDKK
ncbi:MAG: hypothetical protein MR006_01600 [Arcanobacterium sp.]|nr:hypothetical protein [Arcanobacterium sp.]MDY5589145.1 hypothetical protein [Arcanobacterium sp.]